METVLSLIRRYNITEKEVDQLYDLIEEYDCIERYACLIVHGQLKTNLSFSIALRYLKVRLTTGSIVGIVNTHNTLELERIIYILYNEFKVTIDEVDKVKGYCQTVVIPGIDVFRRLHTIYGGGVETFEDAFEKLQKYMEFTKVGTFNEGLL